MTKWPFGIGDARYVSVMLTEDRIPDPESAVRFERSDAGRIFAYDLAGLRLGEVLEESDVLRISHTLEDSKPYVAEIANVAPAKSRLMVLVSWPTRVDISTDVIHIVLSAKVRKQIQHRFRRSAASQSMNEWLAENFLLQGRYLVKVASPEKPSEFRLLSPVAQMNCEMRESTFVWVHSVTELPKRAEVAFERAGLIDGHVDWLSSEIEVPAAAQGALRLLEAITARSEYFDIWEKYRELELEMIRSRVAELGKLNYRGLKYLEQVLRFELEADSETAAWQDSAIGLSVELIVPQKQAKHDDTEFEKERTYRLGTIRHVSANYIDVDRLDDVIGLPRRGSLRVSPIGDEVRLDRQRAAEQRMRDLATPIPNLETLLSTGSVDGLVVHRVLAFKDDPPVTADGKTPDERQQEAVDLALNTPDICIIQGPPGTGKTSVIRTIIKRLKEEGRRHLLITSYQHNAVDNALDGLVEYGVVSYRIGGNQTDDSFHGSEINDWVAEVTKAVDRHLEGVPQCDPHYLQRVQLRDMARSAIETRADVSECLRLLQHMTEMYGVVLSLQLSEKAEQLHLEFKAHLAEVESGGYTRIDFGKLMKFLAELPVETDDSAIPTQLGKVRSEMERLSRQGWGSTEALGRFKVHANKVNHLRSEVMFGLDPSESERKLHENYDSARNAANDFLDLIKCQNQKASESSTGDAAIPMLKAFDGWCRGVVDQMERQITQSQGHTRTIVEEWKSDIVNRPGKVKELFRKHADVWGCTCQQVAARRLRLFDEEFDYVIVDEAARASPLDLLIPLVRARRIILVGDQMQLPHALDYELEKAFEAASAKPEHDRFLKDSLFFRLYNQIPSRRVRLNYQYRMNPVISRMVSAIFYQDDPLQDGPLTRNLINDTGLFGGKSLVWIHCEPRDSTKKLEQGQYYNSTEAELVVSSVRDLLATQKSHSVGVITYYAQQRNYVQRRLREALGPEADKVQVGTVDAFQGIEKDVILLSMVRSNPRKQVGFLSSPNRLNVSLSRARRLLVLIGDVSTVTSNPTIRSVYEYCREVNGVIHQI